MSTTFKDNERLQHNEEETVNHILVNTNLSKQVMNMNYVCN